MQELLFALPVLLMSMVIHEYAHGYAALRQGDPTARDQGRLTLNPLRHIDPFMTIAMPLMLLVASGGRVVFGGAKPVPVDPRNYRNARRGDVIVSSAGVAANFGLCLLSVTAVVALGLLDGVVGELGGALAGLQRAMAWGVWVNVLLGCFNLIPVPPLDGSHLLYHALPRPLAVRYRQFGRYGVLALLVMVLVVRDALYLLLTPAFLLQAAACQVMDPYAITPLPLCGL